MKLAESGSPNVQGGPVIDHRNCQLPICKVPSEVVCKVFLEVMHSKFETSRKAPPWIDITHICRHLREIALTCPLLWSRPVFHCNPALTDLMIARSGTAPLIIDLGHPNSLKSDVLAKVFTLYPRIRTLEATTTLFGPIIALPVRKLSQMPPSPILETLRLRAPNPYQQEEVSQRFSDTLTCCSSLKSIVIEQCLFDWTAIPAPPALEYLKLHNSRGSRLSSVQELVNTLGSLSNLKDINLTDILPFETRQTSHKQPVLLPSVRRLTLADNRVDAIIAFLSLIQVPPSYTIDLDLDISDDENTDFTLQRLGEILDSLTAARAGGGQAKVSKIYVQSPFYRCMGDRPSIALSVWYNHFEDHQPTLRLAFPGILQPHVKFFEKFTQHLDISALRSFVVSTTFVTRLTTEVWGLFRSLACLETIKFVRASASSFVEAWQDTQSARENLPFPALRTVSFNQVDFMEKGEIWDGLITAATSRLEGKSFKIKICNARGFTEESINLITSLGALVEWDGVVDGFVWNQFDIGYQYLGGSDEEDRDLDDASEPASQE